MDFEEGSCLRNVFRSFVCAALTLLLGLHIYGYIKESETFEGDFSDIKYVLMQLSRDLAEVNRKHEQLQAELDTMTAALPGMSAATARARDALEPAARHSSFHTYEVKDYDRQVADYALESAGARILDTGSTIEHFVYESPVSWALHAITSVVCRECLSARTIIQPGNLPGECWAFKGTRGEVYIRLLGSIHITGVSLEHIPPHISPTKEISSAPRLFQLEGMEHRSDQFPHDFGTFEYDKKGKPIQYFDVVTPAPKAYNVVRLRIMSNWGHPVYTCVYRLRVHGELAGGGQAKHPTDDIEMRIDNE